MSKFKLIMGKTRSALFTLNTVLLKEKTQTRGFGIVLTYIQPMKYMKSHPVFE